MPLTLHEKLHRRANREARRILVNRHKAHTQTSMIATGWLEGFEAGKQFLKRAERQRSIR